MKLTKITVDFSVIANKASTRLQILEPFSPAVQFTWFLRTIFKSRVHIYKQRSHILKIFIQTFFVLLSEILLFLFNIIFQSLQST